MISRIAIMILGVLMYIGSFSQQPVQWNYSAIKISDKIYEIHFIAVIDPSWHIYSKDNSEDFGLPTTISFLKSPLFEEDRPIKEIGTRKRETIDKNTITCYEDKVEFVQVIKLKANVKINVKGSIAYMACTETQCLPPETRHFSISVGGS